MLPITVADKRRQRPSQRRNGRITAAWEIVNGMTGSLSVHQTVTLHLLD
jgi:hypothetical protein